MTEPMEWDDVAELLAFCAVFDQRKADEVDIEAWLGIATDQHWPRAAAARVAREHYGSGADKPRLTPAMVSDRLREIRRKAAQSFEAPRIPEGLPNAHYPTWLRGKIAEHQDMLVDQWATSGREPAPAALPPAAGSLEQVINRAPEHLREQLGYDTDRFGTMPALPAARPARRVPVSPVVANGNGRDRRQAREELNRLRDAGYAVEPADDADLPAPTGTES